MGRGGQDPVRAEAFERARWQRRPVRGHHWLRRLIRKLGLAHATCEGLAGLDGVLTVEVADDGRGGADPRTGTGLRGLGDRVSAVDGTLEVVSPRGGGTRIVARIPAAAPTSAADRRTGLVPTPTSNPPPVSGLAL